MSLSVLAVVTVTRMVVAQSISTAAYRVEPDIAVSQFRAPSMHYVKLCDSAHESTYSTHKAFRGEKSGFV